MKITREGLKRLKEDLRDLKNVQRPVIIKAIAEAREHGDLKENAEYHAAKDKQGFIEAQIADYESRVSKAQIVDISELSGDVVQFGAIVTIEDLDSGEEKTYQIVSEYEADIDNGKIADSSPVARALLGKKLGNELEIRAPKGLTNFEIIKVIF
jgi:transcription elongation factor GreA